MWWISKISLDGLYFSSLADKSASGGGIKNENMSNQALAQELHKLIIRKFEKQQVHSSFIGNLWVRILPICK